MKTKVWWFSLILLPYYIQAQYLKPGIYKDFKLTEPLILDTGSYTFIGFGMKDLGNDVWLDARKASKLELVHCTFEGKGEGTAVLSSGDLSVSHCTFTQMKDGILQASPPGSTRKVCITGNVFTDNLTSIRLDVDKEQHKNKNKNMVQRGLISVREDTNRGGGPAIGNFKTEIRVEEDYHYGSGNLCLGIETCCRKAVDGEKKGDLVFGQSRQSGLNPSFDLIPNPASEKVKIKLQGISIEAHLVMFDALGRQVKSEEVIDDQELSVSSLPKGIYLVVLQKEGQVFRKQLVIQ